MRKHCCGNIVARNVSTASKRVGSKTNVVLPCRPNQATFGETLLRTQILRLQQMLRARANSETFASTTIFPQQCFLNCRGLNALLIHWFSSGRCECSMPNTSTLSPARMRAGTPLSHSTAQNSFEMTSNLTTHSLPHSES